MKIYKTENIRNIVLAGSAGAGKTTLAEAMVYEGGLIPRKGDVASKNTLSDYKEIEHSREGSVFSSLLHTVNGENKINIIDAPGAKSLIGNLISALTVADTAVILLNAQTGIESGTERAWEQIEKMNKPVVFAINHLDHEQSNFEKTVEQIHNQFGNHAIIAQYPIEIGDSFNSIIDVITMKMYTCDGSSPRKVHDIPAEEMEKANELHNTLVEAAAENDDTLMEIFFDKDSLTEDEMREGIMKGIMARGMFPIFCIGANNNTGVQRFSEFISNTTRSPEHYPTLLTENNAEVKNDSESPTNLFVFKSSSEHHLGEVTFFKVISGTIKEHDDLVNNSNGHKERISQLYIVNGKNRTKVEALSAGDLGATIKLKSTKTGNTLTEDKDSELKFAPIPFPSSKYRVAIRATAEADEEKLGEALHKIHEEDPTIILEYSKELKQLIIHSQSEFHINTLKWALENEYKLKVELDTPKIPYRETITKPSAGDFRHKKQSGGAGQFGEVHLIIEPHEDDKPAPKKYNIKGKEISVNVRNTTEYDLKWGGKLVFYNCIVGGVIETSYMPAIAKGLMEKMENGPLTGSYARDIRVCVYDGKMHQVDSNEISFKIAGSKAFSEAFKQASPKLLEPVYDVEVNIPSEYMGDAMSDLQSRRALIQGMSSKKGIETISAKVPLAELGRYSTALSSLTHGRGHYEMEFADYSPVPSDLQNELIKKHEEHLAEND